MKKLILLLLFTHSVFFAQVNYENSNEKLSNNEQLRAPVNPTRYIFNVEFHIVKNTNGTGPTQNFGEAEMMNAMKILNTTFNPHSIYFKYKGFDVIQNSNYMNIRSFNNAYTNQVAGLTFAQLVAFSKTGASPVYDNFAMNLFIVEKIDSIIGQTIPATSGYTSGPSVDSVYGYDYFLTPTLPREIAKNFSLLPTFYNWNTTNCELVNGSNSATAGDGVSDTPASPLYIGSIHVNSTTCQYNGAYTDCSGASYGTNILVSNFMSPICTPCRTLAANYSPGTANFTTGQISKMRTFIGLYYNNTSNLYGYKNAKASLTDLYKPYKVTNIGGVKTHYFQKGFDYTFYNTYPASGAATVANTDIRPLITNITIDYCCTIGQINFGNQVPLNGPCLQVLSNLAPYGRLSQEIIVDDETEFISGTIASLKSLVTGSFKTQTLDKKQVNDPNLEENLSKDEYHVITKMTPSGKTVQKVIYIRN
jgi:hypothetical protein